MKFGKELRTTVENSLPEWRPMFMSYKSLKKRINPTAEAVAAREAAMQAAALRSDANLPSNAQAHSQGAECAASDDDVVSVQPSENIANLPRQSSSNQVARAVELSPTERERATKASKSFFMSFREEVAKVNGFFLDKQEDYVIMSEQLAREVKELTVPGAAPPSRAHVLDLMNRLVDFHGCLVLLDNYSHMNYQGFRKILKKHDKKTGLNLQGPCLSSVQYTPFRAGDTVARLLATTEERIRQLEVIASFRRSSHSAASVPAAPTSSVLTLASNQGMEHMEQAADDASHPNSAMEALRQEHFAMLLNSPHAAYVSKLASLTAGSRNFASVVEDDDEDDGRPREHTSPKKTLTGVKRPREPDTTSGVATSQSSDRAHRETGSHAHPPELAAESADRTLTDRQRSPSRLEDDNQPAVYMPRIVVQPRPCIGPRSAVYRAWAIAMAHVESGALVTSTPPALVDAVNDISPVELGIDYSFLRAVPGPVNYLIAQTERLVMGFVVLRRSDAGHLTDVSTDEAAARTALESLDSLQTFAPARVGLACTKLMRGRALMQVLRPLPSRAPSSNRSEETAVGSVVLDDNGTENAVGGFHVDDNPVQQTDGNRSDEDTPPVHASRDCTFEAVEVRSALATGPWPAVSPERIGDCVQWTPLDEAAAIFYVRSPPIDATNAPRYVLERRQEDDDADGSTPDAANGPQAKRFRVTKKPPCDPDTCDTVQCW